MRTTLLENGIRVLTEALPATRALSLAILVDAGPRDEAPEQHGLAHLAEHMFFHGTSSRSAAEIARVIDRLGGQVGAFTARDYTCFHATVLDEYGTYVLDLLSDLLLNSTFPQQNLDREKLAIVSEIAMAGDKASQRAADLLKASVWPGHPLGRAVAGTPDTISSFTREDLIYFVHENYLPNRIVVAAAGSVDHDDFVAQVRDGFWRFLGERSPRADRPPQWVPGVVMEHRSVSQAYFNAAIPAPPYTHGDRYATHVLTSLLGGGLSSRLFRKLREERGLVYEVSADYHAYRDGGMLVIEGSAPPDLLQTVLGLILAELWALVFSPGPLEDELWKVQQQLRGQHLLAGENAHTCMSRLAMQSFYFGREFSSEEVLAAILEVNEAVLRSYCEDTLATQLPKVAIAIVGPEAPLLYTQNDLESLLESFSVSTPIGDDAFDDDVHHCEKSCEMNWFRPTAAAPR